MRLLDKLIQRRRFLKLTSAACEALALERSLRASRASLGSRVSSAGTGHDQDADVIVVGAGSLGCNTAWHLHERGVKVLVLEAAEGPATQTTQAAAGFVASWSAVHVKEWGKTEWLMQRYGIEFYTKLGRDCGHDIGFGAPGIAYIYIKPDTWKQVQPRAELARRLGTQLELLTSRRAGAVLPQINFQSTAGILYEPGAVRVRAGEAIACLAQQLGSKGVPFRYNTSVTGFVRDGARVVGVTTSHRQFRAPHIVVAAGPGVGTLLDKACAPCAAEPRAATRYTTKPLSGINIKMPMLILSDFHGAYIREERGGLLIGGSEDAREMRRLIRQVEYVMPVLKQADVDDTTGGFPTFTKDVKFILDAVPGCGGVYVISGDLEAGITHGPGLGRMMAELVVNGETTWDRNTYRYDRFQAALSCSAEGAKLLG